MASNAKITTKGPSKKVVAKKAVAKASKKAPAKKTAAKKAPVKKTVAKKATAKKKPTVTAAQKAAVVKKAKAAAAEKAKKEREAKAKAAAQKALARQKALDAAKAKKEREAKARVAAKMKAAEMKARALAAAKAKKEREAKAKIAAKEREVAKKAREKAAVEAKKQREIDAKRKAIEAEKLRKLREIERRDAEERKRQERREAEEKKRVEALERKMHSKPYAEDTEFLDELRQLLTETREATRAQIAVSEFQADEMLVDRERLEYDDEDGSSVASDIQRDQLKEFATALRLKVDEIDVALARLDDGSYGRCDSAMSRFLSRGCARSCRYSPACRAAPAFNVSSQLRRALGGPRGHRDRRRDQVLGSTLSGAPRAARGGAAVVEVAVQLRRLVFD